VWSGAGHRRSRIGQQLVLMPAPPRNLHAPTLAASVVLALPNGGLEQNQRPCSAPLCVNTGLLPLGRRLGRGGSGK
jgi:hypothetical protein